MRGEGPTVTLIWAQLADLVALEYSELDALARVAGHGSIRGWLTATNSTVTYLPLVKLRCHSFPGIVWRDPKGCGRLDCGRTHLLCVAYHPSPAQTTPPGGPAQNQHFLYNSQVLRARGGLAGWCCWLRVSQGLSGRLQLRH